MNPGQKVYYTKDNVKYGGIIIKKDTNTNICVVSLFGEGSIVEIHEDDLEETEDEHKWVDALPQDLTTVKSVRMKITNDDNLIIGNMTQEVHNGELMPMNCFYFETTPSRVVFVGTAFNDVARVWVTTYRTYDNQVISGLNYTVDIKYKI